MVKKASAVEPRGTKAERELFKDVHGHYTDAKQDLESRISRKNGFDDADKMFASHIDEGSWPYSSMMFDARPYTVIVEKAARLIGQKPKGRLVPREGGDSLGAMVNNELLNFQWDDNSRLGKSMVAKWIEMDMNARKYGAAFALAKWNYQTRIVKGKKSVFYDAPDFTVCNPRDVLANPSYDYINKWFQHREYLTIKEMESVNDAARTEPTYKNLNLLRESVRDDGKQKGDRRDNDYVIQNKSMRGLSDYMGSDETNKVIEVITEYRPDRWVTFATRHGVILRDIPNPYEHGEIPVVMLKYYPLPDDLYGIGEFEPVSKMIRGINSLFSQYLDSITVDLYPPLMINPVNVRMHTIEFTPEAKWLMNNPGEDVQRLQTNTTATNNFQSAYSLMVSSLLNSWGETSQGISAVDPFQGDKTATEVRDSAFTRNVRDNMNRIFLSEALKKQIMYWHSMNQQLLFQGTANKYKIIRIVGRDAVEYFMKQGLHEMGATNDELTQYSAGDSDVLPEGPRFPVDVGEGNLAPKFVEDPSGGGDLIVEQGDLNGHYDYIPDVESMQAPSQEMVEQKLQAVLGTITNPQVMQLLQMEGVMPKVSELLIKLFESTGVVKDAEQYFEKGGANGQGINQPGAIDPATGLPAQGNGPAAGMGGGPQAVPGAGDQPLMGGPTQGQV
jgi:hypothetical protein